MAAAERGKTRAGGRGHVGRGRRQSASQLIEGDCLDVLAGLEVESVDAVVCDPPYGIDWQGESWDGRAIRDRAGAATGERLSPNDAFEVWCGIWGKECLRVMKPGAHLLAFGSPRTFHRQVCGFEDAGFEIRDTLIWLYGSGMPKSRRYAGDRATGLKPAFEPIVLARRPLLGTVEENVARHGTGLLEVGGCRVGTRYPADVLVSHAPGCEGSRCAPECPAWALDECAEETRAASGPRIPPSRFFYCPKASRAERDAGCEGLRQRDLDLFPNAGRARKPRGARNSHPTVKPLELMRWLVRLVCPPGGLVLDPFAGSGSTGAAAVIEGRRFCGVEREASYLEIAEARIGHWAGTVGQVRPAPSPRSRR